MSFLDGFLPFGLAPSAQYFTFAARYVIRTLIFENPKLFLENPDITDMKNRRAKEFENVMYFLLFPDLKVKLDSLLDDIWFVGETWKESMKMLKKLLFFTEHMLWACSTFNRSSQLQKLAKLQLII